MIRQRDAGQRERESELRELGADEEPAPVDDVGEQTAERRQEQQRPELGEEDQQRRRTGRRVSFSAYAPSTTFCIHVPMFDANTPK